MDSILAKLEQNAREMSYQWETMAGIFKRLRAKYISEADFDAEMGTVSKKIEQLVDTRKVLIDGILSPRDS